MNSSPISDLQFPISNLSLEQKVGQLMMIGFDGTTLTQDFRRVLHDLHPGGTIYFERNCGSPPQLAQLSADLQAAARANGDAGLFIAIDQEGGVVARLKEPRGFTEFPGAMAIAATADVENARRIARAMASELAALGINLNFVPDLDVNNNPANPVICTRSFGSDPGRVAAFGVAFLEAMQSAGIIATGKHFPGHGDTAIDSHLALPTVPHDRARLERVEFIPFRAAMRANVAGIMSTHVTFPAIESTPDLPSTLSRRVLTDLLRGEMGWNGLILTDELTMGALATTGYDAPRAAVGAFRAGADLLLLQTGYEMHHQVQSALLDAVTRGDIPMAQLDASVNRILKAKERFGILNPPQIEIENAASRVGTESNKKISRDVARQAVTLVRDDARLLPLKPESNFLIVETGTFGLGKLMGATTMQLSAQPPPSEISSVTSVASDGCIVIVATSDVAKNRQQAQLVAALKKINAPTIVVAMRSPYDLLYLKDASTYLAIYGANPPILEALAEVLLGKIPASGKLPVEF